MSMVNASEIGLRPLRAAFHSEASHENGLEFRWRGAIEESSTAFILEWMEQRLSQLNAGALNKKRILRVAIELLQNLHHHAKAPKEDVSFEIVSNDKSHWWIRTENSVSPAQEKYLQETLLELNAIDADQLRTIQRNKIAHQERSEHGGGGVGLNEMIRKSLGQMFVEFINCNSNQKNVIFITKLALK